MSLQHDADMNLLKKLDLYDLFLEAPQDTKNHLMTISFEYAMRVKTPVGKMNQTLKDILKLIILERYETVVSNMKEIDLLKLKLLELLELDELGEK